MAIMGLEPPLQFDAIKLRYRELVMKHHPDRNHGCEKSEELLKNALDGVVINISCNRIGSL